MNAALVSESVRFRIGRMRPLEGKRILVTRARHQASALASQLEAQGAIAISVPAIEIVPPNSYDALDEALASLQSFDWLIFTSANAVEVFAARYKGTVAACIAVIGPSTAKAVVAAGLKVDLMPGRYVAEALAERLVPLAAGKRALLVRAEEARDILPQALRTAGCDLTIAAAYRNQVPDSSIPLMRALLSSPGTYPDAMTLTSASSVRSLATLLEASGLVIPQGVVLASIGPITTQAARDLGYEPAVEAQEATIPALVDALAGYFSVQPQ